MIRCGLRALITFLPFCTAALADDDALLRYSVQHEGIEREYFVFVPQTADAPLPVVLAIHGYSSTATGFARWTGLNRHAAEHGYIVVYPQGSHFLDGEGEEASRITSWNDLAANQPQRPAGRHCTAESDRYPRPPECREFGRCAWTSCYDDLDFLERVLDEVAANHATDERRYYVLGVSNGAMMSLRLGCSLSQRFAAVAPIVGQLAPGYDCGPQDDLPMLHLFGGADDVVRYDGKPASDGFIYTTAARTAATWAAALSCQRGPVAWRTTVSDAAGLECSAYRDCRQPDHEVVSCMDPDGSHTWPEQYVEGMPATCVTPQQYDSMPGQQHCSETDGQYHHLGMDLLWDFFSRYSRSSTTTN